MKILYFSWIRDKIGKDKEDIASPKNIRNGSDLIDFLKTISAKHAEALKNKNVIRIAINLEHTTLSHPIKKNDEIALFPPVTGG